MKTLKEKEARVKLKFEETKTNIYYSNDVEQAFLEFKYYLEEKNNYYFSILCSMSNLEHNKRLELEKSIRKNKHHIKQFKRIFGNWEK